MNKTKMICIAAALAAAILCTSCMTTTYRAGESKSDCKKNVGAGTWGSPKNTAVVFGSEYTNFIVLQQNPKFGYKLYQAQVLGKTTSNLIVIVTLTSTTSMFFVQPLSVGSELKVYEQTKMLGTSASREYLGIGGVDVKITKPGLVYYDANDPGHKNELASLKAMQSYFTGTDWETAITNRMQEIENEKK